MNICKVNNDASYVGFIGEKRIENWRDLLFLQVDSLSFHLVQVSPVTSTASKWNQRSFVDATGIRAERVVLPNPAVVGGGTIS